MIEYLTENYKVYQHISPSGKSYVGITKQENLEKRWQNGQGYQHNPYFNSAIKKYGWENFEHKILFDNLTLNEACDKEKELIEKMDLMNPKVGYNLKTGGRYGLLSDDSKLKISQSLIGNTRRLGIKHTEETKQKMSNSHKGANAYWLGKHHTDESKNKMRLAKLGTKASPETKEKLSKMRKGAGNSFYGKSHTEETKEKIRQANLGRHLSSEAKLKVSLANKGKKLSAEHIAILTKMRSKPVIQLSLNNQYIQEWASCTEASKSLGNITHISAVCRGERKSAGGYKWVYKEDYIGK